MGMFTPAIMRSKTGEARKENDNNFYRAGLIYKLFLDDEGNAPNCICEPDNKVSEYTSELFYDSDDLVEIKFNPGLRVDFFTVGGYYEGEHTKATFDIKSICVCTGVKCAYKKGRERIDTSKDVMITSGHRHDSCISYSKKDDRWFWDCNLYNWGDVKSEEIIDELVGSLMHHIARMFNPGTKYKKSWFGCNILDK